MAISTAAAILGGAALSGIAGASSSRSASRAQQRATEAATAEQRRQYDLSREDYAPYREIGLNAWNALAAQYGLPGYSAPQAAPSYSFDPETGQFSQQGGQAPAGAPATRDLSAFYASPGYQFRRDEGMRGLEQSAAARGGAFSGNAMRGLANFNSGLASQEYGNFIGGLQSLAGVGQSATNANAQMGAQTASNIGNLQMAGGEARASGILGQANSLGNAVNSGLNNYMLYQGGWFQRPSPAPAGYPKNAQQSYGPFADGYRYGD